MTSFAGSLFTQCVYQTYRQPESAIDSESQSRLGLVAMKEGGTLTSRFSQLGRRLKGCMDILRVEEGFVFKRL